MPDFSAFRIRRSRKHHYCDWCNGFIFQGFPSVYGVGKVDGNFTQARYHPGCFARYFNASLYPVEGLSEALQEKETP